jgi:hypothetical protein
MPKAVKLWSTAQQAPITEESLIELVDLMMQSNRSPAPTIAIPVAVGIIGKRIACATEAEQVHAALFGLRVRIDDTVGLQHGGQDVLCWLAGHEVLVHPDRREAFDAAFEDAR